ncbi:hypothetical protein LCGC14_2363600 [marine sediment metagenome]|uniref:Uncharacterized protein n=1 Tax=marine sediment metagenome TaxID=412755 RepID=A0A0F9EIB4_9ZZZZ
MVFNRRGLLGGAAAMFAGFTLPTINAVCAPPKRKAILWVIFIAGSARSSANFAQFEVGRKSAEDAGFKCLDSIHSMRERSKFLAYKEVDENYARKEEKITVCDPTNSDLQGIAEGVVALWIEVS